MAKHHSFQADDSSLCRIRQELFRFLSAKGWNLDYCCRSIQSTWRL